VIAGILKKSNTNNSSNRRGVERGPEMARYTKHVNRTAPKTTRQTKKAKPTQSKNSACGFSFKISDWDRLDRFLIMGADKGCYYTSERKLVRDNAKCVDRCLQDDGARTVEAIVTISEDGRAAKNDYAIFALALAAACGSSKSKLLQSDLDTRALALEALPRVCRIGTHLFQFAQYVSALRGWGPGLRKAVARWYTEMELGRLAFQVVKYPQRTTEEGVTNSMWSHRDLLRKSHPNTDEAARNKLFGYITNQGFGDKLPSRISKDLKILVGTEKVRRATKAKEAVALIEEYSLPHEVVPKELQGDPKIWQALLPKMPMTATIRNLGRMTANGLLAPLGDETAMVVDRLLDGEYIRKSRIHPVNVLAAMKTYSNGSGFRGKLTWSPISAITDALDSAFYESFKNVEPTGKRHLLAIDCSGSMGSSCMGMEQLTNREAAAVMALATMKAEKNTHIVGFSSGSGYTRGDTTRRFYGNTGIDDLNISPRQRLDTVCDTMARFSWGGTDCALPMLYALDKGLNVDVFCVYTDNETWAGDIHPHEALRDYRKKVNPEAKLVVLGTSSGPFSIADPDDAGMLDIAGFDSAAPALISQFARGFGRE